MHWCGFSTPMHRSLQVFCGVVHQREGSSFCWPALRRFVNRLFLLHLHRRMGHQLLLHQLMVMHPLGVQSLEHLHPKVRLRPLLHLGILPRRLLSLNRRVLAMLHPPRQMMLLLLRHQLHLGLRTQWSLPLHPTMVGLSPLRRLHQRLRAKLLLPSIHRASSTLHPPALSIHPRCLARRKSQRGKFCAAENLAQYVTKRVAGMHQSFPKTHISLHRMCSIVANHATELPASRPMKLLHQHSPPAMLLRIPRILGIIHQTPRGRGSSRLHGPLAVGNGTRGTNSGLGTECIVWASLRCGRPSTF